MTLDAFSKELEDLKVCIEQKIRHAYLDKYISKTKIDDYKLFILYSIMNETDLSMSKKRSYIVSIMLVQIALDTHDLVPISNHPHDHEEDIKSKQLLVLAGDYYSGLYYLLLSELHDFKAIQVLATAIKEINELKMKLYYNEVDSLNEYVSVMKQVESLLFTRVTNWLTDLNINPFIEDILITRKLILLCDSDYPPPALNGWLSKTNRYNQMKTMIQKYANQLEQYILQSPMKSELHTLQFDDLLNQLMCEQTTYVEEG